MTEDAECPDRSRMANDLLELTTRLAVARKAMSDHIAKVRRKDFRSSDDFFDEQIAVGKALRSAENDLSAFVDKLSVE